MFVLDVRFVAPFRNQGDAKATGVENQGWISHFSPPLKFSGVMVKCKSEWIFFCWGMGGSCKTHSVICFWRESATRSGRLWGNKNNKVSSAASYKAFPSTTRPISGSLITHWLICSIEWRTSMGLCLGVRWGHYEHLYEHNNASEHDRSIKHGQVPVRWHGLRLIFTVYDCCLGCNLYCFTCNISLVIENVLACQAYFARAGVYHNGAM